MIPFLLGVVIVSSIALAILLAVPRPQQEVMIGAVPAYSTALLVLVLALALITGYTLA